MKSLYIFALISIISNPIIADTLYSNAHDVLVETIKEGKATGVLEGEIADQFSRQFKTNSILLVNSTVIEALSQDDCKRIELILTKKDVQTSQGVTDAIMRSKLNYCLDGKPPKD